MSNIPDCRTDEFYNEKYLNKADTEFVAGYDFAVEIAKNFLNNLDIYHSDLFVLIENGYVNIEKFIEKNPAVLEKLNKCISDWFESNRDELITSMIDWMDDTEYKKIKKEVDNGVKK